MEAQLQHDLEIEESERNVAIDTFIKKTSYKKEVKTKGKDGESVKTVAKRSETEAERLDRKTATVLKEMRDEEMKA